MKISTILNNENIYKVNITSSGLFSQYIIPSLDKLLKNFSPLFTIKDIEFL